MKLGNWGDKELKDILYAVKRVDTSGEERLIRMYSAGPENYFTTKLGQAKRRAKLYNPSEIIAFKLTPLSDDTR